MGFVLDFERPIAELEKKIAEMKEYSSSENMEISDEIRRLEKKAVKLREQIYSKLTRWQRVQLAVIQSVRIPLIISTILLRILLKFTVTVLTEMIRPWWVVLRN